MFVAELLHAQLTWHLCCSSVLESSGSISRPCGLHSGSMSWLALHPEFEEEDSGGVIAEPPLQRRRLDTSPAIDATGGQAHRHDPATDVQRTHGASESPQCGMTPELQRQSRVARILAEQHSDLDDRLCLGWCNQSYSGVPCLSYRQTCGHLNASTPWPPAFFTLSFANMLCMHCARLVRGRLCRQRRRRSSTRRSWMTLR